VVLGGSTSANNNSFRNTGQHYPLRLQSILRNSLGTENIEVINVSYSAYSTVHSLILLELDVISWDPDLIIVSHNINDRSASYFPDFALDYSNKYSQEYYFQTGKSIYTLSNLVFQHSQLYWLLRSRLNRLKYIKLVDRKYKQLPRKSYGNDPPSLALEVFKRNLKTIIDIAKANGIQVVLGNQPILEPSEEYLNIYIEQKQYNIYIEQKQYKPLLVYPLHNEWIEHHGAFNKAIAEVAEKNHVLFVDNDAELSGNKEYFIDIVHYTPKGVDTLAMNYANFLLREKTIQFSEEN